MIASLHLRLGSSLTCLCTGIQTIGLAVGLNVVRVESERIGVSTAVVVVVTTLVLTVLAILAVLTVLTVLSSLALTLLSLTVLSLALLSLTALSLATLSLAELGLSDTSCKQQRQDCCKTHGGECNRN